MHFNLLFSMHTLPIEFELRYVSKGSLSLIYENVAPSSGPSSTVLHLCVTAPSVNSLVRQLLTEINAKCSSSDSTE